MIGGVSASAPSEESGIRVMHVQHTQGPLDGSLYATVTKNKNQKEVTTTKQSTRTSVLPNGGTVTGLHNGPLNHSADSGISSTSGQLDTAQQMTDIHPMLV